MKSFTKSQVLKSGTVEMISPRVVDIIPNLSSTVLKKEVYLNHDLKENEDQLNIELAGKNKEDEVLVLSEAHKKAQKIIVEAQKYSDEIIREAEAEKENLREKLEESLRQDIIPKAYEEGYQKGLAKAKEESKKIHEQAKDYLELAQAVLANEFYRVDRSLVQLSVKLSEKILCSALNYDTQKVLNIIHNLALLPQKKQGLKIHLSQVDFEYINQLSEEEKPPHQFILDQSLRKGDAYLECDEGIFDARISSQLEKLEQTLLEELENGRLDSTGQEN